MTEERNGHSLQNCGTGFGGTVKIACIGGGPAGLYFSILMKLADAGCEITVFERNKAGSSFGWGVTLEPELMQKLYSNDPESAREIEKNGFSWREQFIDIRGERIVYESGVDICNFNRPDLVAILAARAGRLGVRIEYGHEVLSAAQLPDADLIVAADGVSSQLRQENPNFGTEVRLSSDKYIWLGTDKVFDTFAYHFIETSGGWLWASSYGVGSGLSTFVVHTRPATWKSLGFDRMPIRDSLTFLEELFKDQLQGHRLMGQVDDKANARWLSFRNVTNQRWHDGRVVLAGDSAHTTHFSAGQGTRLAIEDAIALAENLQRGADIQISLESYDQQRRAELRPTQSQARLSGQWFENISRYVDLPPSEFGVLLHARRSPLLPLLPPRLFYRLNQASREVPILRYMRRRAGSMVKALRNRRVPGVISGKDARANASTGTSAASGAKTGKQ